MKQRAKIAFEENKMWLIIVKHVLIALFLVTVVAFVDMEFVNFNNFIPEVLLTNFELSTWILSNIATALLTITTFTFSIAMVVLTTYASNYSPRVVEDFFSDKANVKVLGVFIGGFVYSIISLLLLNNVASHEKVISAGVAIAYSLVCVVYFVIFIFSVANSIHAQKFITRLYNQAQGVIKDKKSASKNLIVKIDEFNIEGYEQRYSIVCKEDGFIEVINIKKIKNKLQEAEYACVLNTRIGEYVHEGQELGTLYYNGNISIENNKNSLINCFIVSGSRFAVNDYKFAVQKITEIGMRALSAAVNDPNTGIHCMGVLGSLAATLSSIDGKYSGICIENKNGTRSHIILNEFNFEEDLYLMFYQLANYSKGDAALVIGMLDSLYTPYLSASEKNKKYIIKMSEYVYDISIPNFSHEIDIKQINNKIDRLRSA